MLRPGREDRLPCAIKPSRVGTGALPPMLRLQHKELVKQNEVRALGKRDDQNGLACEPGPEHGLVPRDSRLGGFPKSST